MNRSAAQAFALTFSHPTRISRFSTPKPTKSPIDKLPVDVLLIIFDLVSAHHNYWKLDMHSKWYNVDAMSPTLFPFAISAVCSFWKDIMSFVSKFWTRIVIFVDSLDTHRSAISAQFLWARDLPLDVIVTMAQPDRRCNVMAMPTIMRTYINPHLHQMRGLYFDVKSSSSLPSFPRDFRVPAPKLMHLWLKCRRDDGGNDEPERPTSTLMGCQFPVLATLFIDGRNYYNACSRGEAGWTDVVGRIKRLIVSRYKPRPRESR
jgi:hypothetical protein